MRRPGRKALSGGAAVVSVLLFAALLSACRLYKLARQLPPEYADFLSQVRYIITKEEEKIFLELPHSEKDRFIEEFWARRDPDPDTEENEFKTEFFKRVERANALFISEGKPGWLTDRGRIYVLFGPPTDRITDSLGGDYGVCQDIWYYGDFPVVFRDPTCTGDYKLIVYDLTALRDLNLMYMHELTLAQVEAKKTFRLERPFFDFNWKLRKKRAAPKMIEATVEIEIPYAAIWLGFEDGIFKTSFEVHLELLDGKEDLFWEHQDTFEISVDAGELEEKMKGSFRHDISFVLEGDPDRLRGGKNKLRIRLKNMTGGEELKKVMDVSF